MRFDRRELRAHAAAANNGNHDRKAMMHELGAVVMTPFRVGLTSGELSACQLARL
jgi:hypothetical protein